MIQRVMKAVSLVCVGMVALGLTACFPLSPEAVTKTYLEGVKSEITKLENQPVPEEFSAWISEQEYKAILERGSNFEYEITGTTDTEDGVDVSVRISNVDLMQPFSEDFKEAISQLFKQAFSESFAGNPPSSEEMTKRTQEAFAHSLDAAVQNASDTKDYDVVIPLVRGDFGVLTPRQLEPGQDLANALSGGLLQGLQEFTEKLGAQSSQGGDPESGSTYDGTK